MMALPTGNETSPRHRKCNAKSKQSGEQCKRWATPGKTKCVMHGAKTEGVPNVRAMTHGIASDYVRKSDLPAIVARVAELKTAAGKEHALLTGAALMEQKLENAAPDVIDIGTLATARKSIREDLKTSHELTDVAPTGNTTYVVANFDPAKQAPFLARGLEGTIRIRLLDGQPFMLDEVTGGWMPAAEHVDEESQAKYFTRLLLESAPK